MLRKAVFLDRDGIINRQAPPHEYIMSRTEFELLPGVGEAVRALNDAGYLVIIVTNQRGIARGLMTMEDVEDIHLYMREKLSEKGAYIDGIYVCPHNYGECNCRKPDIGMFLKAEQDFSIDKERSWMIGDSESDVAAGLKYGVHVLKTNDLLSAVKTLLGKQTARA